MSVDIHAGKRILYKNGNNVWHVGEIVEGNAEVSEFGLFIPVSSLEENSVIYNIEINNLFLDAVQLDSWTTQYSEYFMSKEDYINFIESEDFNKSIENAYMSDGEYAYYAINKYSRNWLEKQPFEFVARF